MKQNKSSTPNSPGGGFLYKTELFFDKYKLWLIIAAACVLILLPMAGLSQYVMRIIIMIGVYSMLALGLNMLTGYVGQLSLGHAGFAAIGAYTTTILMSKFGVNFFPAALGGACLSAFCGLLLGLPTLRLKGTYLAIVTLGFGEIVKMILMNWDKVTNGTLGIKGIPKPNLFGLNLTLANGGLYYLIMALVVLTMIGCTAIVRSKIGRSFVSIREDEVAAVMMGVPVTRYKVLAFVISAFITGIAGGFYASLLGFIDPNTFTFEVSSLIISIVILGGMGTIRGMILGAAILIVFPEVSRALMEYRFVVYGVVLVLMMRFRPQGILGWRSQIPYKLPKGVASELQRGEAK